MSTATVTIRIITGFTGADYTWAEPGNSKAPEFVNSLKELKTTLKMRGLPQHLIEETVERLKVQRLIEVTF
jgi:hypothetical protein